jgi:hypothetical protein
VVELVERPLDVRMAFGRRLEARPQVGARGEPAARAREHHHANRLVGFGIAQRASSSRPSSAFQAFMVSGRSRTMRSSPPLDAPRRKSSVGIGGSYASAGRTPGTAPACRSNPSPSSACARTRAGPLGFWDQQAFLTPRSYLDAVQAAGGVGIMLPADPRAAEQPERWLDLVDGLLLCGGRGHRSRLLRRGAPSRDQGHGARA